MGQGILFGLSISVLLGPILFLFIEASTLKGFKGGLLIASGAWLSDLMYLTASFYGYSFLFNITRHESFSLYVGVIGGVVLLLIGVSSFLNADKVLIKPETDELLVIRSDFSFFLKGFIVNTFNPFCAIFWLGAISTLMVQGEASLLQFGLFASGSVGTIIVFDLVKILAAKRILLLLSEKKVFVLHKIVGAAIFFIGLFLLYRVL